MSKSIHVNEQSFQKKLVEVEKIGLRTKSNLNGYKSDINKSTLPSVIAYRATIDKMKLMLREYHEMLESDVKTARKVKDAIVRADWESARSANNGNRGREH